MCTIFLQARASCGLTRIQKSCGHNCEKFGECFYSSYYFPISLCLCSKNCLCHDLQDEPWFWIGTCGDVDSIFENLEQFNPDLALPRLRTGPQLQLHPRKGFLEISWRNHLHISIKASCQRLFIAQAAVTISSTHRDHLTQVTYKRRITLCSR